MYTAIYKEISACLKAHDLTPDEMNVLMIVKHQGREQGLSQVDLGARLMVTAHNMTRLIQRIERRGLVSRSVDKKDARVNLVMITSRGSKLLDEIWPQYDQMIRQQAGKISREDQAALSGLMQKWLRY